MSQAPQPKQKANKLPKNKVKKKVLIGPANNKINFNTILAGGSENEDDEGMHALTTLMIRNIPVKFLQADMLKLIDRNYFGKYDYFYLPMDLKTQCSVGFAFINMLHPLYILDFFLEFNQIRWSEHVQQCNSTKLGEIVYANMQGIDEIKKELLDKNIMKKNDNNIKPIIFENMQTNTDWLDEIDYRYKYD